MLSYYHQYCLAIRTHNTTLFLKLFMPHFLCQFWCTFLCYSRWIPVLTNMVHFLYWIHLAFFFLHSHKENGKITKTMRFSALFSCLFVCVVIVIIIMCFSLSVSWNAFFFCRCFFFSPRLEKNPKTWCFFAQVAVFLGLLKYLKWPNPDIFRAIRHVFYPFFSKGDCTEYFLCWLYIPAFPCSPLFSLICKVLYGQLEKLEKQLVMLTKSFFCCLSECAFQSFDYFVSLSLYPR